MIGRKPIEVVSCLFEVVAKKRKTTSVDKVASVVEKTPQAEEMKKCTSSPLQ